MVHTHTSMDSLKVMGMDTVIQVDIHNMLTVTQATMELDIWAVMVGIPYIRVNIHMVAASATTHGHTKITIT